MPSGISAPVNRVVFAPIDIGLQQAMLQIEDTTTMWVDTDTWDDSELWGEN